MEYDPAVSTHKASSITSTTSTSSSGTWDIPTPSNSFNHHHIDNIKPDEDYSSYNALADERISLLDYHPHAYHIDLPSKKRITFPSFMDTFNEENHEKDNVTIPEPIYLQHSDLVTVPSFSNRPRPPPATTAATQDGYQPIRPSPAQKQQREPSITSLCSSSKRSKLNRDLLTDDEKRINHIASEQKRRNTIRTGFKDLTDMIPTLKNINNSKSTILFKAVEYIKHLDKRNRGLREKIASLQVRMSVEGRMNQQRYRSSNSQRYKQIFGKQQRQQQPQQQQAPAEFSHLPQHTVTALIAHKNQQRQLEELQEQLRQQQQLLAKHNITPPDINLPKRHTKKASKEHHYNSISIPSSTSSNSDETELDSYSHMQHSPKKRPWHLL
ncbi:hypothetical protein INT48_002892 [Thamnidium elegans]|uniref:BHLH domain-containing protein n=1 Tax=Thamnidium elegans TaxID=101142 RepID=A0A8H7SI40_9FUNG|nr:hypothetical protein INT48_002892 [Thamnidium elegans]